jgi:uroporphyrinogen decarboxylase
MTPKEAVFVALRHEEVRPVPYSFGWEGGVGERMTRHYGSDEWMKHAWPYMYGGSPFDTDYKTPAGENRVRDPYGTIWRMDRRPFHIETPGLSRPSLEGYAMPGPEDFQKAGQYEAARKGLEDANDRFRHVTLGWGLFERLWTICGFEEALVYMVEEEDFVNELLDRLTDLYAEMTRRALALPIEAVFYGDDWGDQRGVIMGPALWRKYFKPRWARIFGIVKAAGKATICHSCGSVADIIPDLVEIGLDVLESVQPEAAGMNPYELKRRFGNDICFMGGLGSQRLLPFGKPGEIVAEVRRLVREMGRGGGYILAPAKSMQPETPTENAVAAFEAFRNQG